MRRRLTWLLLFNAAIVVTVLYHAKNVLATPADRFVGTTLAVGRFGEMVGNLVEWTADWIQGSSVPFAPSVGTAGPDFGDDFMRGTNPASAQGPGTNFPSALARGGGFKAGLFSPNGSGAGVFALNARFSPADSADDGGFRCAR